MVGIDSFMVNCCALVGSAASKLPATRPTMINRLDLELIEDSSLNFCSSPASSSSEQIFHADQRYIRDVRDQRQCDQINYHERNDPAIDRLQLEPEHGLRDEDVDPKRRVEQADRQVDRHHDSEMHRVDADR